MELFAWFFAVFSFADLSSRTITPFILIAFVFKFQSSDSKAIFTLCFAILLSAISLLKFGFFTAAMTSAQLPLPLFLLIFVRLSRDYISLTYYTIAVINHTFFLLKSDAYDDDDYIVM